MLSEQLFMFIEFECFDNFACLILLEISCELFSNQLYAIIAEHPNKNH